MATSVALGAQDSSSPAQLEPFRTEVNYIRVDMYPTADGKPVMDLRPEEVEILDEGVPQRIERFEHVLVRGARSQDTRREPSTPTEMREAMQDVRARLFVLFLDTEHVEFGASLNIRGPLIQSLNEMIGGDDLIALMTADMEASYITFSRRTTSIEDLLRRFWSERDHRLEKNPDEERLKQCIGTGDPAGDELIFRLREVRTLNAIEDLVQRLRFVREERKAVIAITQGWRLYRDLPAATRPPPHRCLPALAISNLRNDMRFIDILQQANTGNVSFYPVDPRGLVVFDENIVPISPSGSWSPMLDVVEDSRRLQERNDSLRTMAAVTDGLAVVQAGNLSAGMRRIVEDLSSYYLMGYSSTQELDGKFHRLTVRVKRPGVRVRARTGYMAATLGDDAKARATAVAAAAATPVDVRAAAVEQSWSALGIFARERPLRVRLRLVISRPAPRSSGAWLRCPQRRGDTTGAKAGRPMQC